MKIYFVYIMANRPHGVLYTGFTSNLVKRIHQHKTHELGGFTQRYNVHNLVFYEVFEDVLAAINREKRIKRWRRKWKLELIEKYNPYWFDLYDKLVEEYGELSF